MLIHGGVRRDYKSLRFLGVSAQISLGVFRITHFCINDSKMFSWPRGARCRAVVYYCTICALKIVQKLSVERLITYCHIGDTVKVT